MQIQICFLTVSLLFLSFSTIRAEWEYKAVYNIEDANGTYSINLANDADSSMLVCFEKTDEASSHGIHDIEQSCVTNASSITNITAFATFNYIVYNTTYRLQMNENTWLSIFNIKFPEDGYHAFFSEHLPSEFHFEGGTEMEMLKDGDSHDVKPAYVEGSVLSYEPGVPWKDTMLGCLAVWSMTIIGVFSLVNVKLWERFQPYACMFASGTLFSTAFCLVLFEAVHLVGDGSSTEALAAGRWAAMVLCGFLSPSISRLLLLIIFPGINLNHEFVAESDVLSDVETTKNDNTSKALQIDTSSTIITYPSKKDEHSILTAMFLGDFFHNFCDGIFIGAAMKCNPDLAWSIVGITVAHELPQEIADFSVLTGKLEYSTSAALLYNVICGFSVMLGGIVLCAAEDVGNLETGMLLAYGAGAYLNIASVHLFEEFAEIKELFLGLLSFCIGATAIGLILLDHAHCEMSSSSGDAHAGH